MYTSEWSPAWEGVSCTVTFDLDLSSTSLNHNFAIKLLQYSTSFRIHSTTCTVLDGLYSYLTMMIISMRGFVACNDLWCWLICSRSFSCHVAHFMELTHMWHKKPWWDDVSCTISRSLGQSLSTAPRSFDFCGPGVGGVGVGLFGVCILVDHWYTKFSW